MLARKPLSERRSADNYERVNWQAIGGLAIVFGLLLARHADTRGRRAAPRWQRTEC